MGERTERGEKGGRHGEVDICIITIYPSGVDFGGKIRKKDISTLKRGGRSKEREKTKEEKIMDF